MFMLAPGGLMPFGPTFSSSVTATSSVALEFEIYYFPKSTGVWVSSLLHSADFGYTVFPKYNM